MSRTIHQNAVTQLAATPFWHYCIKPSNLAFYDFTVGKVVPPAATSLLGLSSKFIVKPEQKTSSREMLESMDRLERDVHLKIFFAGVKNDKPRSKLYVKSDWRPDIQDIPQFIDTRLERFSKALTSEFRRHKAASNLLPYQEEVLEHLRNRHGIVIANSDKGLGPCAIELDRYIKDAMVHLLDEKTYEILTEEEALNEVDKLREDIKSWLKDHEAAIDADSWLYIDEELKSNVDPFGYFYLLYKIHKLSSTDDVDMCPTRPVCSSCGSLDHPLGAWVNMQLQPVAQAQPSFFKNSNECLKLLQEMELPENAFLFTADTKSMYTNIDTDAALKIIPEYLIANEKRFSYNAEAVIAALHITFKNNLFRFNDWFAKQKSGTAMGKRPAPPWATLFFGIKESGMNGEEGFLKVFEDVLRFYK